MRTVHGRKKFEKIQTQCTACGAVSFGSPPGSKHRMCPKSGWELQPGKKQKFPHGKKTGRGTWKIPWKEKED